MPIRSTASSTLAGGIARTADFADHGQPSFFLGAYRHTRQLGVLPGLDPGQVADSVPDRRRASARWSWSAAIAGTGGEWRRCSASAAMIASVMPSTINLGSAAHPAGISASCNRCCDRARAPAGSAAVADAALRWPACSWSGRPAEGALAAPDYLAYFNQLALGEPQRIVTGSDLDWGHDVGRLAAVLKQQRVDRLHLALHTSADLRLHGLPPFEDAVSRSNRPPAGSRSASRRMRSTAPAIAGSTRISRSPAVGASIRLYYVPESAAASRSGCRAPVQLELVRTAALLVRASGVGQSGAAPPSLTGSHRAGFSIATSGARPLRDIQRER